MTCTYGGFQDFGGITPDYEYTTSTCSDPATSTIDVVGLDDLTLIISLGTIVIAALISALMVAKLWK